MTPASPTLTTTTTTTTSRPAGVAGQGGLQLAAGAVPQPGGAVVAAGDDLPAVGGDCHRQHRVGMTHKRVVRRPGTLRHVHAAHPAAPFAFALIGDARTTSE